MSNDKLSLNIKSAEINFIYSFMPVCNFVFRKSESVDVFPDNNYVFPDINLKKKMFPKSTMRPPEYRMGRLSAYLALKQDTGYESLPYLKAEVVIKNSETTLKEGVANEIPLKTSAN